MADLFLIHARPALAPTLALLRAQGLPAEDLTAAHLEHFFFAGNGSAPIGLVGIEIYGSQALLRSLAVARGERRRGLGTALVRHAEDHAARHGATNLFLLTTTAEEFFGRLGYARIERTKAPLSIQQTREFSGLCPASSAFMTKQLLREMTASPVYNVLFLCTGNSARSIMAESLLNHLGAGRFRAFSAGSFPKGAVHPLAIALLTEQGLPTRNLRSKSWDEFASPAAPALDFIFTVCDNAAGEMCPVWPGKPVTAHWGIADPAAAEGTEVDKALAFRIAFQELEMRIRRFVELPIASLAPRKIEDELQAIGRARS